MEVLRLNASKPGGERIEALRAKRNHMITAIGIGVSATTALTAVGPVVVTVLFA
ncbi:hypothetical protein [Nesterenkonia sp. DZ6]|uniref:hypothetical protein n=1 Tax=Nesterenkonia sp. DZ6 TaxID=2901229 RepID=UPI001F4D0600|nr:hypothetical protein [Nesterenkonia sp. DZ6]MCH8559076.1 hypothetical protein [Nesterenkonia sp. DZ6]